MDDLTVLKKQVKKYLDNADEKTIKMVYCYFNRFNIHTPDNPRVSYYTHGF